MDSHSEIGLSFMVAVICFVCHVHSNMVFQFLKEPSSVMPPPESGRTMFRCVVTPSTADIFWLWNGQILTENMHRIKISRQKLTVRLPKQIDGERDFRLLGNKSLDGGVFQCLARHKGKALLSQPAKLILADLDNFPHKEDIYVNVTVGNTAVIPCTPPKSVPASITEFDFNGLKIDKSRDRHKLVPSGNLHILNAQLSDSGPYQCTVYNPFLEERKQAFHKVYLRVSETSNTYSSKITVSPQPYTSVVMGSNITIECAAVGHPPPNITWKKEGGHLPKLRHQVGGNLLLFNIKRGDEGTYHCEANNGIGNSISSYTVLQVQEIPQIVKGLRNERITDQKNVTFECVTRGQPTPLLTWLHNGEKVTQSLNIEIRGNKLILYKVGKRESGIYQCFATNPLGSTYSAATLTVATSEGTSPVSSDYEDGIDDVYDYSPDGGNPLPSFLDKSYPSYEDHGDSDIGGSFSLEDGDKKKQKKKKKKNKKVKMVPPSRPDITRLSDNSVMVMWKVPDNDGLPIHFFKVQYKEVGKKGGQWMTIDEDIAAHIHSFAVTGLKPNAKYRFRIAAVYSNSDNTVGHISEKFTLHKDPHTKKPVQGPAILFAEAVSPSAITLNWKYHDIDAVPVEGFFIYYRTTHSAGEYSKVTVLGSNTKSHIISHLLPDTTYDIKMQCFNVAGTSEFSKIFTCKTLVPEIRNSNSRPMQNGGSLVNNPSGSPSTVSSRGNESGKLLYIVLGIVLGVMIIVLIIFAALYIHRQRHQNPSEQQRTNPTSGRETANGHVGNGYIPKVNISVNPLSQLEVDDPDKPDQQFDDISSNNNEVIRLQILERNGRNQEAAEILLGQHVANGTINISEDNEDDDDEGESDLMLDESARNDQALRNV